ncbi:MAG TPA: DUF4194 domain-containing protein [Candidatus Angelobacter sp.]|nr:DUF4194 domain-containing protein [Candidatus Angelobacter sp.]
MIDNDSNRTAAALLERFSEHDRERLGESLRALLAHGSILGLDARDTNLYHWSHQNRGVLDELADLLDFKLHWDHDARTVQAVPQSSAFLLRLRLDATLVLLTLWYEFDTAVRDRGETPPIRLSVQQLNDSLAAKFEPLRKNLPSQTRLREILSLAQRKNLLRITPDSMPERSVIEALPTLKRVIPFQDLEDWCKNVDRYLAAPPDIAGESNEIRENDEDSE